MRRHWWYRGRRAAVASLLRRAGVLPGTAVLDVGCGTGHMGTVLSRYGEVTGVEASTDAIECGDFSAYRSVCVASALDEPAFPDGRYDLIALLDVLEHVTDDGALLAGLGRRITPGGHMVVSVPMGPELFCAVDELAGHHRRYSRESLTALIERAELDVVASTGYVVGLLPVARWHRRRVMAGLIAAEDELSVPSAPVNGALTLIAVSEGAAARWFELPDGLSRMMVLRRRNGERGPR